MSQQIFESKWRPMFERKISAIASKDDPAHDLLHFHRVVGVASKICAEEGGRWEVVIPAAWLHDLVIVPKSSPLRSKASRLSAESALEFLREIEYPSIYWEDIAHAIEAHSFSAGIAAKTLEAKIVQDADRLDGLGAIGVARCFATAGLMKRSFYSEDDPFCNEREPDDGDFTIDHFYKKLFRVAESLQTYAGRRMGIERVTVMRQFLSALREEIGVVDLE